MRALLVLLVLVAIGGCGKKPCSELADRACELAPGSVACEKAGRLTANDECADYLKDVKKYVELSNLTFSEPGVKPPVITPAPEKEPAN